MAECRQKKIYETRFINFLSLERISVILFQIVVKQFSVFLFLLLDVVQSLPDLGVVELEDSRVVGCGNVFFRAEQILDEVKVFLARVGRFQVGSGGELGALSRLLLALCLAAALHDRCLTRKNLVDCIQMLFFVHAQLPEQLLQHFVSGLVYVLAVFLDA